MSKEVSEEGQNIPQHGKDYADPPPAPLLDLGELKRWSFYRALIAVRSHPSLPLRHGCYCHRSQEANQSLRWRLPSWYRLGIWRHDLHLCLLDCRNLSYTYFHKPNVAEGRRIESNFSRSRQF